MDNVTAGHAATAGRTAWDDTTVDDTARADVHAGDTTPAPPVEGPR
ncbi:MULTISPECIES: hypothetical protein [Streptomyces]|nr:MULTISPECIES: hypothetical protein [Streptomyces]